MGLEVIDAGDKLQSSEVDGGIEVVLGGDGDRIPVLPGGSVRDAILEFESIILRQRVCSMQCGWHRLQQRQERLLYLILVVTSRSG